MIKKIIYIALLLFPLNLHAEKVTETKARAIATQFMQTRCNSRSQDISLKLVYTGNDLPTRSEQTDTPFYVYDNTREKGFVIVSGESTAYPILGYATDKHFETAHLSDNLKGWFSMIQQQINLLRKNVISHKTNVVKSWKQLTARNAAPEKVTVKYETALWSTHSPFSDECPIESSHRTAALEDVLLAIVMRYHKWPDQGIGTAESYLVNTGKYQYTIPARNLEHPYHWDKMPLVYNRQSSEESKKEVARLVADCGVMIKSFYTKDFSSGSIRNIPEPLVRHMKYAPSITVQNRSLCNSTIWHALLQKSLKIEGPIMYDAFEKNYNYRSSAIFDGYTTDNYYSVNWGNNGKNNGYYLIEATDLTNEDLIEIPLEQTALIGIKKKDSAPNNYDYITFEDIHIENDIIPQHKPFNCSLSNIHRITNDLSIPITLALWITDKDGNRKEKISKDVTNENDTDDFLFFSDNSCWRTQDVEEGDRVRLFFKTASTNEWQQAMKKDNGVDELIIANSKGEIKTISSKISLHYNRLNKVVHIHHESTVTVRLVQEQELAPFIEQTTNDFYFDNRLAKKNSINLVIQEGEVRRNIRIHL